MDLQTQARLRYHHNHVGGSVRQGAQMMLSKLQDSVPREERLYRIRQDLKFLGHTSSMEAAQKVWAQYERGVPIEVALQAELQQIHSQGMRLD